MSIDYPHAVLTCQYTAMQNGQIVTESGNSANLHLIVCLSVISTNKPVRQF